MATGSARLRSSHVSNSPSGRDAAVRCSRPAVRWSTPSPTQTRSSRPATGANNTQPSSGIEARAPRRKCLVPAEVGEFGVRVELVVLVGALDGHMKSRGHDHGAAPQVPGLHEALSPSLEVSNRLHRRPVYAVRRVGSWQRRRPSRSQSLREAPAARRRSPPDPTRGPRA